MVAVLRDNGQVRKRGRPRITPTNPNWEKYRVRTVGLDGTVIKERAFEITSQRLTWLRQVQKVHTKKTSRVRTNMHASSQEESKQFLRRQRLARHRWLRVASHIGALPTPSSVTAPSPAIVPSPPAMRLRRRLQFGLNTMDEWKQLTIPQCFLTQEIKYRLRLIPVPSPSPSPSSTPSS